MAQPVLSGEVPPTHKGPSPLTIWSADKRKRAVFTVECTHNEPTHLKQLHSADCSGNDQAKQCYSVKFIIALLYVAQYSTLCFIFSG
jgi:hypothetical protein